LTGAELPSVVPEKPVEPPPRIRSLWAEADEIWERRRKQSAFSSYVSADYHEVYQALVLLQGRAVNFLEWGSGLGVATIMASTLGFDAYGIESESHLVDWSRKLAREYGPEARFTTGSFIPEDYEWDPECADESFRSEVDAPPGYDDLDLELCDFDLVYAYPWPDEYSLFLDIMRQCGGRNSLFLIYDVREGMMLSRPGHDV
jgi:hypothetical protein